MLKFFSKDKKSAFNLWRLLKKVEKRTRCVLSSLILSVLLLFIHLFSFSWQYEAIGGLAILSYFLSAWALSEGLSGAGWFTILALPALFTGGVGLFYFLIPAFWYFILPVALVFGVGFYFLLLTENIFSVAALRNIQLLRSAQAAGFLITLVVTFFLLNATLSLRLCYWQNFIITSSICFVLALQALWTVKLENRIGKDLFIGAFLLAIISGQVTLALSFWPLPVSVFSLGVVAIMYVILGLLQHRLNEKLFKKTIIEYVSLGVFVMAVIVFSVNWRG
jgi:hypothetical protein